LSVDVELFPNNWSFEQHYC